MASWLALLVGLGCAASVLAGVLLGVFAAIRAARQRDLPPRRARPRDSANYPEALPATARAHCPECGTRLPPDAPEGLCPQCLLKGVISSAHDAVKAAPAEATAAYAGSSTAPAVEELAPLFPQLEIIELIGQGGMGAVYKARQPSLDRFVAVKVLPRQAGQDPAFAERFNREARALARLSHPNIVAVHDVGKAGDFYYFVMEYVDGVNLRQLLRDGHLCPEQALRIVPQVCDALQFAHEEGIVHRDIKPENILLDKKGRVKIADFGLAKLLGRDTGDFTLTGSRQVMGTLYYMAPEQIERPLEVDHRADIYSLGVVFYELLTGQLPVGRFPMPSEKAGTDAFLDEVVLHALEREPAKRYQHASEVKTDVESHTRRPAAVRGAGAGDVELARHQLQGPANALTVMGVLGPLEWLVIFFVYALFLYLDSRDRMGGNSWFWAVLDKDYGPMAILFLVNAVVGGFLIAGARKMRRLQAYEFSVISTLMSVLQLATPTGLISVIIGGWGIWVLRKPEVREAFAVQLRQGQSSQAPEERQSREQVSGAAVRVRWPALGLLLTGILQVGLSAALLVGQMFGHLTMVASQRPVSESLASAGLSDVPLAFADQATPSMGGGGFFNPAALPFVTGVILGPLILLGAVNMLRLRSHAWALTAAILALLPCGPVWLIGMPFGLWALAVLTAPDVKAAFGRDGSS